MSIPKAHCYFGEIKLGFNGEEERGRRRARIRYSTAVRHSELCVVFRSGGERTRSRLRGSPIRNWRCDSSNRGPDSSLRPHETRLRKGLPQMLRVPPSHDGRASLAVRLALTPDAACNASLPVPWRLPSPTAQRPERSSPAAETAQSSESGAFRRKDSSWRWWAASSQFSVFSSQSLNTPLLRTGN